MLERIAEIYRDAKLIRSYPLPSEGTPEISLTEYRDQALACAIEDGVLDLDEAKACTVQIREPRSRP